MKFNVSVIETVGFTIDTEANTKEEAKAKVEKVYNTNNSFGKGKREVLEVEFITE